MTKSHLKLGVLAVLTMLLYVSCGVPTVFAQSLDASPLSTPSAQPQSPINLTVSPVTLSIETNPGTPVQAALKIRNNSDSAEQLVLSFGTFKADSSGERPQLLDPKPSDTFLSWLTSDSNQFTVAPGEWKTINLTFSPPQEAALAYYYTVIINRANQTASPGETAIKGAPAVLLLTTVNSPNAKRSVDLVEFKARWPMIEYLPQIFQVSIKNTGNIHIVPAGNIFIDGQGKKDLAVLSLNPSFSSILPDSTRTLEVEWTGGFPVKESPTPEADTDDQPGFQLGSTRWDFSQADQFRFGKYTAHLLMVYDNGERDVPIESFVSFWVLPWKLILIGLLVVGLALAGLRTTLLSVVSMLRRKPRT